MSGHASSTLSRARLNQYRDATYRLRPRRRVRTQEEAISFVEERGFVFFWPIQGAELPSLWTAVAGDRPVADEHDDPGHVTWGWKDSLLGKRRWYYAKILRKRATLISLEVAPAFYALTENYGAPEEDYLIQYEAGRMTAEAKLIYEALLRGGPMDTVALRRATRMTSRESSYRFERGLSALQADFKILPIGVAEAGAWRYAFIYDLVHRHLPDLPEQARTIMESEARRRLLELYFRSVGAAQVRDASKVFQWSRSALQSALQALVEQGVIAGGLELEGSTGEWLALRELVT